MVLFANIFGRWVEVREVYSYHDGMMDANIFGQHCIDIPLELTEVRFV